MEKTRKNQKIISLKKITVTKLSSSAKMSIRGGEGGGGSDTTVFTNPYLS